MTPHKFPMRPMLEVRALTRRFGGVTAVDSIDLQVAAGELVSVIGPNGAGKTTLFNLITGLDQPDAGTVHFHGGARGADRLLGWGHPGTGVGDDDQLDVAGGGGDGIRIAVGCRVGRASRRLALGDRDQVRVALRRP